MGGIPDGAKQADAPREPATTAIVLPIAPGTRSPAWMLGTLVAVAAVLPYLNTLAGGFVFDDHGLITANPYATPGMPAWQWLLRPSIAGSVYRPITMMTYALDAALGAGPSGYHATNIVLHLAATLVAFALARRLFGSVRDGALAATLFAVHPIHTEAVANLAGRAELLAGGFALASLWAVVRYAGRGGAVHLAIAFVAALAAVGSKESAFALPLLAVIVLAWHAPERRGRAAVAVATITLACLAYVAARVVVIGPLGMAEPRPWVDNPLAHVGTLVRLGTALVVLSDYLGGLTLPMRLSADDTFDQVPLVEGVFDVRLIAAVAVFAIIAVAAFRARRRVPAVWFGALFAAAALAITANVLFPIGTIKAERLLYLPSVGWCLAGAGLVALDRRRGLPIAALVVLAFAGRTWARNDDWRDDYRLFTATVAASPNSVRAHSNAGMVLAQRGEFDRALAHFEMAVRIYPGFVPAQIGRGRLLVMRGRTADALAAFDTARHADPTNVEAHLRAADLRLAANDAAAAEQTYREGLVVAPRHPELLLGLALAQATLGRREEARTLRDRVGQEYDLHAPGLVALLEALRQALGE